MPDELDIKDENEVVDLSETKREKGGNDDEVRHVPRVATASCNTD